MVGFASTADLVDKQVAFDALGSDLYAHTAEGDPNSGVIVGPDGVTVVDARDTPALAAAVIARIATVTDRRVNRIVLLHYHAVRMLGASGYGANEIICSDVLLELIAERGPANMASEISRFPRLFRGQEGIPGLAWPTLSFHAWMSLGLGEHEAQIIHIGRAHTMGDTVAWPPKEKMVFAGDTVEFGAAPCCGDADFADWGKTLRQLRELGAEKMVPGRRRALLTKADLAEGIAGTNAFISTLFGIARGWNLKDTYRKVMEELWRALESRVILKQCTRRAISGGKQQ